MAKKGASPERSSSPIKAICKGHRFVESDLRLLLLNKHKKFDNDAIARFCSSIDNWNKSCQKPTIELAGRLGKNLTLAHWTLDISEVMLASKLLLI